jgi:N-acetylglutamate synthase-like GNAT family acetyltransferase
MHIRSYNHKQDYQRVGDFLIEIYQPGEYFLNWLQPRWEYMHYHPNIQEVNLEKFGILEDNGDIVGMVHPEHVERQIYFQVRPGYDHIKPMLFDYAEENFQGISQSTGKLIRAMYINEHDKTLTQLAESRGYEKWTDFSEDNSRYLLDKPVPEVPLPEGFHLQSLADETDLKKINRVLWRGFNHEGPPPEEEIPGRKMVMSAPNFRKDLTIVAVAPDGNYASYSGIWVVPENRIAYVEPVATDPDYRRMGLGKAAVLECVRRAAELDIDVVWVGSGLEFYKALGFKTMFTVIPWVKVLE